MYVVEEHKQNYEAFIWMVVETLTHTRNIVEPQTRGKVNKQ